MAKTVVELVGLPEASANVGASYLTSWRLVARGAVPVVRRGGKILVNSDQLRRALMRAGWRPQEPGS